MVAASEVVFLIVASQTESDVCVIMIDQKGVLQQE